jgi:hypothetical protein
MKNTCWSGQLLILWVRMEGHLMPGYIARLKSSARLAD